ncbi:hypothetical protein GA0070614_0738 [Micromonospora coxensis]|uniref:Uncharacterized protein n=2 Tax=Micromonospora coxensis TaxID=356852 RepID=A0A1C5H2Q2_9ACTN|nr:hypothetical protein GA0070614_0738 [Micromonospora coxensis]
MSLIGTLNGLREPLPSLSEMIDDLPSLPPNADFGDDIARAHHTLLSDADVEEKRRVFFQWVGRWQPCLFGRLAAHAAKGPAAAKGLEADICWLTDDDLARGADHVSATIQQARRRWKDRAEQGLASGFLIMFNSRRLAFAAPGKELLRLCLFLSDLYLIEHAPIRPDVIYTEAAPLRIEGRLHLFKVGCNIFYSGAHGTRNHDRRVPGGLMFSMNSPGHYANSLHARGFFDSLPDAIEFVRDTAFRSIGNGGLGASDVPSQSWHNRRREQQDGCPVRRLPSYVPPDFDPQSYSALYHTDVLVPTAVTVDGTRVGGPYESSGVEVWPNLLLDYITDERFPADHENYGQFQGHPVDDCNRYHNPWQAREAWNDEQFRY